MEPQIWDGFHELEPENGGFQFWGRLVEWKENLSDEDYNTMAGEIIEYLNELTKIYKSVNCDDEWRELMSKEHTPNL
ncbi:MAG: hypothetical protein HQK96_13705 [Nitrospirae bacterium]|nr:hypothetical protein [Nitrospirota bacterium]